MKTETKITVNGLISLGFLLIPAILIFIFSLFSMQVEEYYSLEWYPAIANTLRIITRNLPFSIGDILGLLFVISLIVRLSRWVWHGVETEFTLHYIGAGLLSFARKVLWIFIVFNLIWGLNYSRMGIAYQLNLEPEPYQKDAVVRLTNELMDSLNASRRQIKDTALPFQEFNDISKEAYQSYQSASMTYHFLNYRNRSVKQSMFSGVGDLIGFIGYFNPFTGEAQIRSDIPRIMVPYITCHEMAHQLGYASESEASFVGYLAASTSKDPYFKYSLYLELFSYAQNEELLLYSKEKDAKGFDSVIKFNRNYLDTLVKKDRIAIRQFFQKRKNKISPAFDSIYDQYLKINKQTKGIQSYDDVLGWLMAYRKRTGKI
ncbi:MAG: DUF3810 domain-containing protein [Chitinophagaceae bacterium]|nr:DUF3810 domain-containing protein [Chitinophagaceae bacterium]